MNGIHQLGLERIFGRVVKGAQPTMANTFGSCNAIPAFPNKTARLLRDSSSLWTDLANTVSS